MTAVFEQFIDITGANFPDAPLDPGDLRAVYVTGTDGVEETAAQIAELKAAGMGVVTIDQTPGLAVFAAGQADVADIESQAGTDVSAEDAVVARRALGITQHCLYVSQDSQSALKASIADPTGVVYWIANYADSETTAEQFITANADVVAVQYGDPASNPGTDVPGSDVPLSQAQADIDVCLTSWAAQFMPGTPAPAPSPAPAPASDPTEAIVQQLPLVVLGDTGPAVGRVQALLLANMPTVNLGTTGPHKDGVDQEFGELTETAVHDFQASFGPDGPGGTGVDSEVGFGTWSALLGV